MPFIPHTEQDIQAMLQAIGVDEINALFDEIPADLRNDELDQVPYALNEMEVSRLMHQRAAMDKPLSCFAGAGAYEHHIPAAVWEIATRGEFYSAYTPYQAEASQGTLQLLYEYQSMMASLTGLNISNASLYDGASALAEAVLMAVRGNRKSKSKRILMPRTVNPVYRDVVKAIVHNQGITLDELDYQTDSGTLAMESLPTEPGDFAALVIPQPNFFGSLEEVDQLTDWAHQHKALVIGVVNPTALAVIVPPGDWGEKGADIACGEGQPLGLPLSSGGPYFGFITCSTALARQMPGRIIGRTVDLEGKAGFVLTLQAREQHIRRSKATSNICTNQGLMVTAATIYMSLMGPEGLERVALQSHNNTTLLKEKITAIGGITARFNAAHFHELVVQLDRPADGILNKLAEAGILGGIDLSKTYPELKNSLLVCATETKTAADINHYASTLASILAS